jgi:hypothetical protein
VALAFAIGLGASTLWLRPAVWKGEAPTRAQAAIRPETPAARTPATGALLLKIDADSEGFAARAASTGRR